MCPLVLYAYVRNHPLGLQDPLGLAPTYTVGPGQTSPTATEVGTTVISSGTGNTWTYTGTGFEGHGPNGESLPFQDGDNQVIGGKPGQMDTSIKVYAPYDSAQVKPKPSYPAFCVLKQPGKAPQYYSQAPGKEGTQVFPTPAQASQNIITP